jgi:hypothetical protein
MSGAEFWSQVMDYWHAAPTLAQIAFVLVVLALIGRIAR